MTGPATGPAIETRGLRKQFGARRVLDGLDLQLAMGGVHAVVGANGAGKSTLFRILLGFTSATAGEAWILGRDSRRLRPEDRGRIGFVNEDHSLPGWMRVDALIAMQRAHHRRWDDAAFRAVMAHVRVAPQQVVGRLSRGERAGLSLALALGQAPDLLVLDEPTLGLDVVARRAVLEAILAASGRRCTIVYCSHQMDEIERLADHMTVLDAGRLVCAGAPDELRVRVRLWLADLPFRGPDPASVPGLIEVQQIDGVSHYLVLDQGEGFAGFLRGAGARSARSMDVDLERAIGGILAHRRGRHA